MKSQLMIVYWVLLDYLISNQFQIDTIDQDRQTKSGQL